VVTVHWETERTTRHAFVGYLARAAVDLRTTSTRTAVFAPTRRAVRRTARDVGSPYTTPQRVLHARSNGGATKTGFRQASAGSSALVPLKRVRYVRAREALKRDSETRRASANATALRRRRSQRFYRRSHTFVPVNLPLTRRRGRADERDDNEPRVALLRPRHEHVGHERQQSAITYEPPMRSALSGARRGSGFSKPTRSAS